MGDCGLYVIHNMKAAVENMCVADKYEGHDPTDKEIKELRNTIREQIDKEIQKNDLKKHLVTVPVGIIDEILASKRDTYPIGDSAKNNKGTNNGSDNKQKAEAS